MGLHEITLSVVERLLAIHRNETEDMLGNTGNSKTNCYVTSNISATCLQRPSIKCLTTHTLKHCL